MSETDPGSLSTSQMELAVTIINSPPPPRLCQVSRIGHGTPAFIVYYPHYCYPAKSPTLAMILFSLLYLFASKLGKIWTSNSIDSFPYLLLSSIYNDSSVF